MGVATEVFVCYMVAIYSNDSRPLHLRISMWYLYVARIHAALRCARCVLMTPCKMLNSEGMTWSSTAGTSQIWRHCSPSFERFERSIGPHCRSCRGRRWQRPCAYDYIITLTVTIHTSIRIQKHIYMVGLGYEACGSCMLACGLVLVMPEQHQLEDGFHNWLYRLYMSTEACRRGDCDCQ